MFDHELPEDREVPLAEYDQDPILRSMWPIRISSAGPSGDTNSPARTKPAFS